VGAASSAGKPETGSGAADAAQEAVAAAPVAPAAGASEEGEPQRREEAENVEEEEAEEEVPFAPPLELIDETAEEDLQFDWYILKVQVNREDAIKEALQRRIKREGMEKYFKEIIVPTEDVIEFTKTGKRRTVKRKLYPGYLLVNMAVTDESWFLVRETPAISRAPAASPRRWLRGMWSEFCGRARPCRRKKGEACGRRFPSSRGTACGSRKAISRISRETCTRSTRRTAA
jgi:transcriptional antiterminator NusG